MVNMPCRWHRNIFGKLTIAVSIYEFANSFPSGSLVNIRFILMLNHVFADFLVLSLSEKSLFVILLRG